MNKAVKSYLKTLVKNYTDKDVEIFDKDVDGLVDWIVKNLPGEELRSCKIVTKSETYEIEISDYVIDGDFYVFSKEEPVLSLHKNHIISIEWNYQKSN